MAPGYRRSTLPARRVTGPRAGQALAVPTPPDRSWPDVLWVVRHGESSGNVARDAAEAGGLERIDIAQRDMDVPLSDTGHGQAEALGRWFADSDEKPTVVWTSPYVRARQTAEDLVKAAGLDVPLVLDERLREREFGVLDGLTRKGIIASSRRVGAADPARQVLPPASRRRVVVRRPAAPARRARRDAPSRPPASAWCWSATRSWSCWCATCWRR
jgi:broad specificity phosphatase PhoE